MEELGTAIGAFEMLAGDALGAAASSGPACGTVCSQVFAGCVVVLTDDVDVPTL